MKSNKKQKELETAFEKELPELEVTDRTFRNWLNQG